MPKGYSTLQIGLHWIIAILIGLQFLFNEPMAEAWDAIRDGAVPVIGTGVWAHILFGSSVLALVLWRLAVRVGRGVPAAPSGGVPLLDFGASLVHWALYALMVLVPASGLAAWFGGVAIAGEAHSVMTTFVLVLVGLHVVAALWHQFWLKDGLLMRILRPAA